MRIAGFGLVCLLIAFLLCVGVGKCVDVANAKETSTLDSVVDRPPSNEGVIKFVDKDSKDRCYYRKHTHGISCMRN